MNFSENITKSEALDLIKNYGAKYYKFLPNSLRKDKDILLLALQNRWQVFIFASKELKRDKEVILQAVKYSANILNYVGTKLKAEVNFANKLIDANADSIKFIKTEEISLENAKRVAQSPNKYLHFLTENYRKNPEIVLLAVKSNWQNVYDALVLNREIVLNAVKGSWNVLEIIPEQFRQDAEIFKTAYSQNKWAIKYFPFFLNDRKIIELLIQNKGFDYRLVGILPKWVLSDSDLAQKLVANKGLEILLYISPKLHKDKDLILLVLDMLKNNSGYSNPDVTKCIFQIVSKYWLDDKEIMSKVKDLAIMQSSIVGFICNKLSKQNGQSLVYKLVTDEDISLKIIKNPSFNYKIVRFLPQNFLDDKKLMLCFIANKGVLVLQYVSPRLQQDRQVVLFAGLAVEKLGLSGWGQEEEYGSLMSNIILKYWADDKEVLLKYLEPLRYIHCKSPLYFYNKISPNLQQDKDILFSLFKIEGNFDDDKIHLYESLPEKLRKNEDFCVKLLQIAPIVFKVFDAEMQVKYLDVALQKLIAKNNRDFIFLDDMPQFRENAYICLRAIEQNRLNIQFVSEKLKDDKDFMREAIKINCDNYYHISKRLENDVELKELARSLGCKIWNK